MRLFLLNTWFELADVDASLVRRNGGSQCIDLCPLQEEEVDTNEDKLIELSSLRYYSTGNSHRLP